MSEIEIKIFSEIQIYDIYFTTQLNKELYYLFIYLN